MQADDLNDRLLAAARNNSVDDIRRLIAAGAAPDPLKTSEAYRQTPLLVASERGNAEAVEALLVAGANPNRREGGGISGDTPLMVASRLGHEKVVERLLDHGANPNAWFGPFLPDRSDEASSGTYTALTMAVAYDQIETARRLLLAGADVHQGHLNIAITHGNAQMVKLLLAAGASPREPFFNGRTPLEEAQRLTGASREPVVALIERFLLPVLPKQP